MQSSHNLHRHIASLYFVFKCSLLDRKKQWDKEDRERRACRTDPDMPPGHRLMLDDERRQTLERIKQSNPLLYFIYLIMKSLLNYREQHNH